MNNKILEIENLIQKSFYYLSKYKTTRINIRQRGYDGIVYSKDVRSKTETMHRYGSSDRIFLFNYFGLDMNNVLISENGAYYLQSILEHRHINVEMCKSLFVLIRKYFTILNDRRKLLKGSDYYMVSMDAHNNLLNHTVVILKDNLIFSTIRLNSYLYKNNFNNQEVPISKFEETILNKLLSKDKLYDIKFLKLTNEFIKLNEAHELLENI